MSEADKMSSDGDGAGDGAGNAWGEVDNFDQGSVDAFFGVSNALNSDNQNPIQLLVDAHRSNAPKIPMMDAIFDRLLRLMKLSVRKLGTDLIELRLQGSYTARFSAYLEQVPLPSVFCIIKTREAKFPALIVIDGTLIAAFTDAMFGGSAGTRPPAVEGRAFSSIELNTIRPLIDLAISDLNDVLEPIEPMNFEFDQIETNPRFATIVSSQSVSVIANFALEIGVLSGGFQIVIPLGTLDPVREKLTASFIGGSSAIDRDWEKALANHVARASMVLDAVLFKMDVPISRIMNLQVGDLLMTEVTKNDVVELQCNGVPLSKCRLGQMKGNIAVSVQGHVPRDVNRPEAEMFRTMAMARRA